MSRLDDPNVVKVGPSHCDRDFTAAEPIHLDRDERAGLLGLPLYVADATARIEAQVDRQLLLGPALLDSKFGPRVHV